MCRQQAHSKLFIEDKSTPIFLTTDADSVISQMQDNLPVVYGTTTNGEPFAIPTARIVSAVGVLPRPPRKPRVQADTGVMYGVKVTIRSAAAVAHDDKPGEATFPGSNSQIVRDIVPEEQRQQSVCVLAEDLAEALVLIVGPDLRDPVWVNPAVPDRAIRRYLKIVRLTCEAEMLVQEANAVEDEATLLAAEAKDADKPLFDDAPTATGNAAPDPDAGQTLTLPPAFPGNEDPRDQPGPCAH